LCSFIRMGGTTSFGCWKSMRIRPITFLGFIVLLSPNISLDMTPKYSRSSKAEALFGGSMVIFPNDILIIYTKLA
jgi:hypothetical protein